MEPLITTDIQYVKKSDSEMDRITTTTTVTTETFSLASLRTIKTQKESQKVQDETIQAHNTANWIERVATDQADIDAAEASIQQAIDLGLTE